MLTQRRPYPLVRYLEGTLIEYYIYAFIFAITLFCIESNPQKIYFGIPTYFFRASFTSAIEDVPIVKVQWIPYITVEHFRTCKFYCF